MDKFKLFWNLMSTFDAFFQSQKQLYDHKCPSVCQSAKLLNSLNPSSLIRQLSSFNLHNSTFILHHFATFKLFRFSVAKATLQSQMSVRPSVINQNPPTAWNLHPSSFILHPSFFILHSSTFIFHNSSSSFISRLLSFSACLKSYNCSSFIWRILQIYNSNFW